MTNNRDRLTALLLTLLVGALTVLVLVFTGLSPVVAQPPAQLHPDEIFYEVMELPEEEVILTHDVAPAAEASGVDTQNAGTSNQEVAVVSSSQKQPDNTQVKQQELATPGADTKDEKPRRKPGVGPPKGTDFTTGTEQGTNNNSAGNDPYAIAGRGIVRKPHTVIRTTSAQSGWVDVDITVTPQGKVTKAEVTGSSGFGNEEEQIRTKAKALLLSELEYSADSSQPTRTYTKRVKISQK